jgi:malate dehydrogenase (oxaloacetate-decarboxylating)
VAQPPARESADSTIMAPTRGRNFRVGADGAFETWVRGLEVLETPILNKGSAFTRDERRELCLTGLLPPAVTTMDLQAQRSYQQYMQRRDDIGRFIFLSALHDRNEFLFYRLLGDHLEEMLPIVYTPTVGLAIERYSQEFQRPRGLYLCIDDIGGIDDAFRNFGAAPDDIDLIVATDGEQILGIGDWGVGGIAISVGKLAVYTAAAGIDPTRVIPVVLDSGTDREALLGYRAYMGARHARVRGERYDAFIDAYVRAATTFHPQALLHWEDFAAGNARRILDRYRGSVCTFNDDMQGTGAVVLGAVIAGSRASGTRLRDHRVVILGAGTAGVGIADQLRDAMMRDGLTAEEATRRIWCVGRRGLLVESMGEALRDFQRAYARSETDARELSHASQRDGISLLDVVRHAHPTVLIGTAGAPGAFTEPVVRAMAAHVARPIILPLSNPTSLSEAHPSDLIRWTGGGALVATGSPFAPVDLDGITYEIGQANNAFAFPGLGLGTIVARATSVSDGMLTAAAEAIADCVDASTPGATLAPPVQRVRDVSRRVAISVARAAQSEGVARASPESLEERVMDSMWNPTYRPVRAIDG